MAFQSTPPARGATAPCPWRIAARKISIHAPREGGDFQGQRIQVDLPISIHAPREGGDFTALSTNFVFFRFQSTPPARGATAAPCPWRIAARKISIHAPREGGDIVLRRDQVAAAKFQSTPPARGATRSPRSSASLLAISIHAPREGGDPGAVLRILQIQQISIHAPREGGDAGAVI